MTAYDRYITSGNIHRCACGQPWSDADGGPCHEVCVVCGCWGDPDKLRGGVCPDCFDESQNN